MTTGELRNKISLSKFHQARGMFSPVAMIQKFYPGRYQDRTTGMTCHAIADLIRNHVDVSVILNLSHCLLLPPTFESAKGNIDELLNEDEKFLGDIPGDESVEEVSIKFEEENLFEDHLGQHAEFWAVFLRQNRNFLGEDVTNLFVADAHAMHTIEDSTSGDNKGLGEPTTPSTKITKGKRASRTTGAGATKAIKTNASNADYNPSKKSHNSNNNGKSIDE